jgi:hypothetical protein
LGPWLGFTEKPIDGDQFPVRGLTGDKGKVGEKVQELMAGSGVAGIKAGRCGDGGSTDDRAGAVRSRGGGSGELGEGQEGVERQDDGEQDYGGLVATVVERRRNRESEMWPCERVKVVEEGSWMLCRTKKNTGELK